MDSVEPGAPARVLPRGVTARSTSTHAKWRQTAALLVAATGVLGGGTARADRRPPFGNDAQMLETRVREEIEHRIAPLLEQMAPGQAELKYVDVRVARPTALPAGAAPGFEELTPGTEFVAEKAEVSLVLDAKLPPPFRKDLKNLIKNRLDGLAVPVELQETVIPFPTPRPQPQTREQMPYAYPPSPPREAQAPAQTAAPTPPTPAPSEAPPRGAPWVLTVVLAVLAALIGGLAVALVVMLAERRARRRDAKPASAEGAADAAGADGSKARAEARAAAVDRLPEVRRALREDRVLARRVMGELLRENQLDTVAVAVELVGPSVVEDLRADPACVVPLREAAALLVEGRAQTDTRDIVEKLHRRILKHRMVGAEDPVEQEFAFLLGLSPARLGAVLGPESPAVQAAGLRYAPVHLRSAYLADRSPGERAALAAALAAPKSISKEHLLDVAATLRARAAEQEEILEAMRRADPAKARAVEAALISDETFERVSDEVLAAAAMAVPSDALARFLREAPESVARRALAALPRTVAAGIEEELSLEVAPTPQQTADARRAVYAALRKALRDRGLASPSAGKSSVDTGKTGEKGKVVAI